MTTTPKIIELVGPAGAGKTTLARALEQRNENVARRFQPQWRDPRQLPFFAWNGLASLPTYAHLLAHRNGKWLGRDEIGWIAMLHGWHRQLRRPVTNGKEVYFIDQGAISILTVTHVHDYGLLGGPAADEWRTKMFKEWVHVLDMVIWLDAPNEVLAPRIRARADWHSVKEKADPLAFELLDGFRAAYERTFAALTAERSDLKILRFDTTQQSLEEECDQVSRVLGLKRRERSNGHH